MPLNRNGVLREIARGQGEVGAEWRARWKASKDTGSPLFGGNVVDWNPSQLAIAYWFSFYDNVFEHPDRPPMKIINNDDLLDKWVEKISKEVEDRASKQNTKSLGVVRGALDHDEMIVFEDADDIYYDDDSFIDADGNDIKFDGIEYT